MPWVNLTVRKGALTPDQKDDLMSQLTDVMMFWEKVPNTPAARTFMRGWIYEVDEGSDYEGGSPNPHDPYYFLEFRVPDGRLSILDKQGLIRDFTTVMLRVEGSEPTLENLHRVFVTIAEIKLDDWGLGGHTDWLRSYLSALESA